LILVLVVNNCSAISISLCQLITAVDCPAVFNGHCDSVQLVPGRWDVDSDERATASTETWQTLDQ